MPRLTAARRSGDNQAKVLYPQFQSIHNWTEDIGCACGASGG